jgi:hypothetical protein
MRVSIGFVVTLMLLACSQGRASASCTEASTNAAKGIAAYDTFKSRLFHHGDAHGAIQSFNQGVRATQRARSESCQDPSVNAAVLTASAALLILHATLELNAAPDDDNPQCPLEHRKFAKSDVASSWFALTVVHGLGTFPDRYDEIVKNTKLVASRLGLVPPSLNSEFTTASAFQRRYDFAGKGECFHNPLP